MNTKQKIVSGLAALALVTGSIFGGRTVYNRGYEHGRQEGKQEVKSALTISGNRALSNCNYDSHELKDWIYHSSGQDKRDHEAEYKHELGKRDVLMALMDDVLEDHILIR